MPNRLIRGLGAALAALVLIPMVLAAGLRPIRLGVHALYAGQIRTTSLKRVELAREISAYGIVLGPGRLVTLAARVVVAGSTLAAARARADLAEDAARRAVHLYHAQRNISEAALQQAQSALTVAQSAQESAAATLRQCRSRLLARWGVELSAAAISGMAPLPALEAGRDSLIEVSLPLGEIVRNPPEIASAATPAGERVRLHFISRAPRTAAGVAGESLFYVLPTRASAPIGTPLAVALKTRPRAAGVRVPRSAVVWRHGNPLVFREAAPGWFTPVKINGVLPSDDGYFVPQDSANDLRPRDRIVVQGAALLYSAAQQPAAASRAEPAGEVAAGAQ